MCLSPAQLYAPITLHPLLVQAICHCRPCRYPKDFLPYESFLEQACDFLVVVIATFPEHHTRTLQAAREKACPGQRFVLVVHNPDVLLAVPPGTPPTFCNIMILPLRLQWVCMLITLISQAPHVPAFAYQSSPFNSASFAAC